MIINTGSRTDTVQYYSKWLLKQFDKGYVYSRNPLFPNKVARYELSPDVLDCIIFCSKNYEPILPEINKITEKFNTYFHYTITAYGRDIEPNVPDIDKSIETLIKLSEITGRQRIAWRYDPVLLTKKYTKKVHYQTFEYMAQKISPYVDRCIFSFVEMYGKLKTNMPEIMLLNGEDKSDIAEHIGLTAKKYNMIIQTCAEKENYGRYGISGSGCITSEILGKANNITFKELKHKGNRIGCSCAQIRNIGDYNTCPNGCRYCYANKNPKTAMENYKKHNPEFDMISGNLKKTDEIIQGNQKSFLVKCRQTKLFYI